MSTEANGRTNFYERLFLSCFFLGGSTGFGYGIYRLVFYFVTAKIIQCDDTWQRGFGAFFGWGIVGVASGFVLAVGLTGAFEILGGIYDLFDYCVRRYVLWTNYFQEQHRKPVRLNLPPVFDSPPTVGPIVNEVARQLTPSS